MPGTITTHASADHEDASTAAAVRRDGEKTWIDGVPGFSPGEFADSVHGCEARVLQVLGEALDYDDLVGYSGFAFRASVHVAMCPSAGHPCCGYMCIDNGVRSLPWTVRQFAAPSAGDRSAFEAEACAAIRTSIDRGIPVPYGSEENGLIFGYADAGRRWRCVHPYHKGGSAPFWHDEAKGFAGSGGGWPWTIAVWVEPRPAAERVPGRELLLAALEQAVDMWSAGRRGDYFCGDAAYTHWIDWLRGVDSGTVQNPRGGMQGNGWCYDVLVHARRTASRWLTRQAATVDRSAREHLLAAAESYRRLVDLTINGVNCPWDIAPGPARFDAWSPSMRTEQISRLTAARHLDAEAIAHLQNAAAALRG